jgi:hypothetical protein
MLEHAKKENFQYIVSWVKDKSAFKLHNPQAFIEKVMPNCFDQAKYGIVPPPTEYLWFHPCGAWCGTRGDYAPAMFPRGSPMAVRERHSKNKGGGYEQVIINNTSNFIIHIFDILLYTSLTYLLFSETVHPHKQDTQVNQLNNKSC